jgi:hypothetical protein
VISADFREGDKTLSVLPNGTENVPDFNYRDGTYAYDMAI